MTDKMQSKQNMRNASQHPSVNVIAYRPLPAAQQRRIEALYSLRCIDPFRDRKAFEEALPTAHALIGSAWKLDRRQIELATQLRVLSSISAGVDHVDTQAIKERGITLCSTRGAVEECVADLAFALILATSRRLPEMMALVGEKRWRQYIGAEHFGYSVHGKTLGLLGFGGIGQAIAQRAAYGFNMPVQYYRRTQNKAAHETHDGRIQQVSKQALLANADLVVSTLPLTNETKNFMDVEAFRHMKQGSIFINVGRGGTVDEHALLEALASGRLFAAGLDVFATEPLPTDSPLTRHPRIITLPHIGAATHETRQAMLEGATTNLLNALAATIARDS